MDDKKTIGALLLLAAASAGVFWLVRRGRKEDDSVPTLINPNNNSNTNNTMATLSFPDLDMRGYGKLLSRGYRNNNPVNIEYNAGNSWLGQTGISPEGRFAQFESLPYGYRAALALLRGKGYIQKGINTIRKMIEKFAPKTENYTETYIRFVSNKSGIGENVVISKNDKDSLCRIVWAMAQFENENTPTTQQLGLPDMNIIYKGWELL